MADTEFGTRLRQLRLAKGFTKARHFANILGISENRYTRYERGGAEPEFAIVMRICATLGVTPNDLFGIRTNNDASANQTAPVTLGFSDDGAQPTSGPAGAHRSSHTHSEYPTTQQAMPAGDAPGAATWRLANSIARMHRSATAADDDEVALLQDVGRIYLDLQNAPYGSIAHLLAGPQWHAAAPENQKRIHSEINDFLASINNSTTPLAAPRNDPQ